MTYRDLTKTLLLLCLAATIGLIFASAIPGAWWQWLAVAVLLLFAAAMASNAADERGEW